MTDANTIDPALPAYSADEKRRKKLCQMLRRLVADRDRRIEDTRRRVAEHRGLREAVSNEIVPPQDGQPVKAKTSGIRAAVRNVDWTVCIITG